MSWLALPLLLAASPPAPKPPAYQQATATVQIVAAEEIRFTDSKAAPASPKSKAMVRQARNRGGMPMVEFY